MNDSVVYAPDNWSAPPLANPDACLSAGRCTSCGRAWFPRPQTCPECLSTESMTRIDLSRTGTLYAYSVIHIAPAGFKAPYVIGYVDLPEGVRVFGHLDGCKEDAVECGAPVRIYAGVIGRTPGDEPLIGVRFAPMDHATVREQHGGIHGSVA